MAEKKEIKDVYEIKPGKTYWVTVGDKSNPELKELVKKVRDSLKKKYPDNKWIVSSYNIKPCMVNKQ